MATGQSTSNGNDPPPVCVQVSRFCRLACQHVLLQVCSGSFWANMSLLVYAGMSQIPADVLASKSYLRVAIPVALAVLGFIGKSAEQHEQAKQVCESASGAKS